MKYIYHHLGLGDHIICNGLVRTLFDENERYFMFVKPHNLTAVKFMYKDLSNLDFLVGDDLFAKNYINNFSIPKEDLIVAGFYNHPESDYFDESFYLQNKIPVINRWLKFKVDRDINREMELFNKYNVKENQYVFVHDDESRGFEINEGLIVNKDLPIIRPKVGLTENIFDYCYLMENSVESHFIDSSFRLIFDSLKLRNSDIFYHLKLKNGKGRNGEIYNWADSVNSILKFKIID
jgi:hypothetical protein